MSLEEFRKIIVKSLNFSPEESVDYENRIYNMCKTIYKEKIENDESIDNDEFLSMYQKLSYEKVGQLLDPSLDISKVLKDIENCITNWDSVPYKKFQDKHKKNISAMTSKPDVQSGGFPCKMKDCRSYKTKETIWYQSQTRSGDEGMTTYVTCMVCGDRYKIY